MLTDPFPRLSSALPGLRSAFLTKEDAPCADSEIAALLGASDVAALHQVHGARTVVTRTGIDRTEQADGLATDADGLCLTIRAADCQTLLVAAPDYHVIGLLHAGWKGLLAGAIPAFFHTLQTEWGIGGGEVFIGLGPSLCQDCADFTDPLHELPGIDPLFFRGRCVDLRGIADRQLAEAGVQPDRIERPTGCTRCRPDLYWTYRGGDREAVREGRVNVVAVVNGREGM